MTDPLFVATAPVFTVDGQVRGELARDILRLEVLEDTLGLKRCTARFIAQGPVSGAEAEGLLYLDGQVFDFGRALQVSLGPAATARTVFDGAVSAIEVSFRPEREPQVLVRAEDRLMDLRLTRRMKTWEQMSDADIASAIGAEHGIPVQADVNGPTYDRLQQWNQSDLAFLRERALAIGAELWFDAGTLHFAARDRRSAEELTLVQGNQLLEAELSADLAHQRSKVVVSGWDAEAKDPITEEAGDDAVQAEAGTGRTGAQVLQQAFGERPSHRVRDVPLVGAEAADWARAEMLRRARAFVTVRGVTDGSPAMAVGGTLNLEGVGAPFEGGGWRVTEVLHSYDLLEGYRTRFSAERPTVNGS